LVDADLNELPYKESERVVVTVSDAQRGDSNFYHLVRTKVTNSQRVTQQVVTNVEYTRKIRE
jgi:hypothetical protein